VAAANAASAKKPGGGQPDAASRGKRAAQEAEQGDEWESANPGDVALGPLALEPHEQPETERDPDLEKRVHAPTSASEAARPCGSPT